MRTFANLTAHDRPSVGDIKYSAVSTDHMGWLICDGRTVTVADFRFLFDTIGYSFGGSNDTFVLPNPAGKVAAAVGTGTDINMSTSTFVLGSTFGEYMHTLTIPEMPSHNHGVGYADQGPSSINTSNAGSHNHGGSTGAAGFQASGENVFGGIGATVADEQGTHTHTISTDGAHTHVMNPAGGSNTHNNVQPTLVMGNMFIYSGRRIFPTLYNQSYNGWPQFYQGNGTFAPPNPPLN